MVIFNNRRAIRASLGTRTARRHGTKTRCIPGLSTQKPGPDPKFSKPRYQALRSRFKVAALAKEAGL